MKSGESEEIKSLKEEITLLKEKNSKLTIDLENTIALKERYEQSNKELKDLLKNYQNIPQSRGTIAENMKNNMNKKYNEIVGINTTKKAKEAIGEENREDKKLRNMARAVRGVLKGPKEEEEEKRMREEEINTQIRAPNNEDFQNAVDMHNVRDMWKRIKSRYLKLIDDAKTMKEKMKIMKAAKDKIHSVHLERYWNKFLKYAERKMKENAPKKEKSTVRSADLNKFVEEEGANMPDKIGHELVRAFGSWNITFLRQDFRNMAKMGFRRMTRKRKERRNKNEARNTVKNPMRNNNPFQEVIPISNNKSTYLPPPSANNKEENEWNKEEVEEVEV